MITKKKRRPPMLINTVTATITSAQMAGQIHAITATSDMTLPTATAGLDGTFFAATAVEFGITPVETDIIVRDGTTHLAGSSIMSDGIALSCVRLRCLVAGTWVATTLHGTFTLDSVYAGTITGLRISAVDGTAFIDNAGATIPTYADGNHLIEIYDSSNRMLKGVLKAVGTGETYSEKLTGWTNYGYDTFENTGKNITSFIEATAIYPYANTNSITVVAGELYRTTFPVNKASGTYPNIRCVNGASADYEYDLISSAAFENFITLTVSGAVAHVRMILLDAGYQVNASVNPTHGKVLTPSTSGAVICSSKVGDPVYNWSYKNSSFTYNSASNYCIVRKLR